MSSPVHILCITDQDDEHRRLSQELLSAFPAAHVHSVSDGVELSHVVEQIAFNVAIIDITLGGLDSFSILDVVKKRTPACSVILFTTRGSEELAVRALKNGFDDYIGKTLHRYELLTASVGAFLNHNGQAFLNGETQLPLLCEADLRRKDGDRTPIEERACGVRTPQGPAMWIPNLFPDGAAHKRLEERLREEVELNAAFARVMQEMIASLNTTAVLERLCRVATEVLGCDCSHTSLWDSETREHRAIAGYGDTAEQWELIRALKIPREVGRDLGACLLKAGDLIELECVHADRPFPDGAMRKAGFVTSLVVALRRGERVIGSLFVSYRRRRKFSEQQKRLARGLAQLASLALANARLLEEVGQANRLKEDFAGAMSHELRTPLNIILGYSQLLCEKTFGELTVDQTRVLDRVQASALELLKLVDMTLDLSRLQGQHVPLEICEVHVPTLLHEAATGAQQLPHRPDLQVQWNASPDLPLLQTDAGKLKIVLRNLVANALKFTEYGGVTISAAPHEQGVVFTVTDTGPGIAAEELSLIFEPFRQGGASATRRRSGVGLGLYIVQQLLKLLGGTISVQSELGRGSTFAVWLPRKRP